jgi:glycosyltransferase involved in cell wall biosynthesis
MTLWAIMMVKDEEDVIEPVLRHIAAQGVDGILVAENGSTDLTRDLLDWLHDQLPCPLFVKDDPIVGYWQSRKMTALANEAHQRGADWIWPVDADELWYYGDTQRLADVVRQADGDVIHARLWHHFRTGLDDHDAKTTTPFQTMQYRWPDEAPIGKVIVRWRDGAVLEAGNHGVTSPGALAPSSLRDVQIRHFPYRSAEQFIRKAINGSRAYAATDLPRGVGQHWREYGQLYERGGEDALRDAYYAHFVYDLPSASRLVYDPARLDS